MDDYDCQMVFGELVDLELPNNCLTGEENPEKTSQRKAIPTGDRIRTHCVTGSHATACSTAIDQSYYTEQILLWRVNSQPSS